MLSRDVKVIGFASACASFLCAGLRANAGSISTRVIANSVAKMACQSKCARIQLPSRGARAGERPTSGIMVAKIRFVRLAG